MPKSWLKDAKLIFFVWADILVWIKEGVTSFFSAFLCWSPLIHQVMTEEGWDPKLWHFSSYSLFTDIGLPSQRSSTWVGRTKIKITSNDFSAGNGKERSSWRSKGYHRVEAWLPLQKLLQLIDGRVVLYFFKLITWNVFVLWPF